MMIQGPSFSIFQIAFIDALIALFSTLSSIPALIMPKA